MIYKLTIPGKPKAKQRPRFGGHIYSQTTDVNYESFVKSLFYTQYGSVLLKGPIYMKVIAYFAVNKGTNRDSMSMMSKGFDRPEIVPDADNVIKIIADSLNGIAYADDKQIVNAHVRKFYSDSPRVEVEIGIIDELGAEALDGFKEWDSEELWKQYHPKKIRKYVSKQKTKGSPKAPLATSNVV